MRLSVQIIISMLIAVFGVGLLAGEGVRYFESSRLHRVTKERALQTISLLNGLMIDAIMVEDVPLIESELRQAVSRSSEIFEIIVSNEDGKVISAFPKRDPGHNMSHHLVFTQNVELGGEIFGKITVHWSQMEEQKHIENNVFQTRIYAAGIMLTLTFLFVFLIYKLVLCPLKIVHDRMVSTLAGKPLPGPRLPKLASKEFVALANSVSTLDRALTERDQREEALRIASKNADAASKSKSEFLANMSHEIRTPMNGVIGMAELMLETELDQDQHLYTETIAKSGMALLTIINDILDFSKIEAGKMSLETAPFNLHSALEDIVTLVASKAAQNNVEVSLRYDPDLPIAFDGDPGRIRQIITNIIGNAVKFTSDGQVIINATGTKRGELYDLEISITDTGVGIPDDNLKTIFQEFEQVDGAATRKFEGTGLGLAISTRLVRMMGGNIEVESKIGEGSSFTLKIPLRENQSFVEAETDVDVDLTGKRVLIVDDLKINRTILSEQLRNWNAEYKAVASAREALEMLNSQTARTIAFDLVVLDFQMPDIDGFELARRIRAIKSLETLPLILLSSVEQSGEVKKQKEFGFSEVLMKPARSAVLKRAISVALLTDQESALALSLTSRVKPKRENHSFEIRKGLRLLVAEDNKTNQLVVRTMLKGIGAEITVANNGIEAKEHYVKFPPEMILMDMSMPKMDGLQATQDIRLIEAELNLPRCPIIALTANAMKGDREQCLRAGMDDYLSKPIIKANLLETLAKWQFTGQVQSPNSTSQSYPSKPVSGLLNGLGSGAAPHIPESGLGRQ